MSYVPYVLRFRHKFRETDRQFSDLIPGNMAMSGHYNSQTTSAFYGRDLAKYYGAEESPAIVTRSLRGAEIAVTDLRVNKPNGRLSDPMPREDACMICLILQDLPHNAYWEEGRQVGEFSLRRGHSTFSDLRRQPLGLMDKQVHSLLFYLPHTAINALADETNVPRIDELRFDGGVPVFDEAIMHLGLSLTPAFHTPDSVSRLFTDHVTLALASHVAQRYGGMQIASKLVKGGLAPWQEKKAKEMIAGNLTGATPLHEVAAACGLSVNYFSRAFRTSTGLAPHAWLLQARVDQSKAMLRKRGASLSDVALACGFADRSHFSRVFARQVGMSPGTWRKAMVDGSS
jgi:AraC family transcriptional regulator